MDAEHTARRIAAVEDVAMCATCGGVVRDRVCVTPKRGAMSFEITVARRCECVSDEGTGTE